MEQGTQDSAASANGAGTEEDCAERSEKVRFGFDSTELRPEDRQKLDAIAEWLKEGEGRVARINAYADTSGPAGYNEALSRRRAEAVQNYLSEQGIDASRVVVRAGGELPNGGADQSRVALVMACQETAAMAAANGEANGNGHANGHGEANGNGAAPMTETPPEPVETEPMPEPTPPTAMEPMEDQSTIATTGEVEEDRLLSGIGVGFSIGGGVIGFTDEEARDVTDPGGSWEARLTLGTRTPIGLELAYLGSAQNLEVAGLDEDALLVGNGGEAALRLQLPFGLFRPYAFGGIGWTRYDLTESEVGFSGIQNEDDVGTVPFGLGFVIGSLGGFQFDVRGTGRVTFDDEMLNASVADPTKEAQLHNWNVTARLGGEF